MKISELNNKAFLGSAGAAENSYVLINYEDSETDAPVTYKATLQELGRAIANDQQLYKKTQNGMITTMTSNGAYINNAAENFASMGDINNAVNGLASTGYVTNAVSGLASAGAIESAVSDYVTTNQLATTSYVDSMVEGLASTGDVTDAVSSLVSTGDISDTIDNLKSQIVDYSGHGAGDIGETLYELYNNDGNASIGYVDDAVSGLASTGYVTNAVANAGGGSFDPIDYVEDGYQNARIAFVNDSGVLGYYSGGASTFELLENYVWYDQTNQVFNYRSGIYNNTLEVVWKGSGVAYIDSSDNKPCIRDEYGDFVGFLSTT